MHPQKFTAYIKYFELYGPYFTVDAKHYKSMIINFFWLEFDHAKQYATLDILHKVIVKFDRVIISLVLFFFISQVHVKKRNTKYSGAQSENNACHWLNSARDL